MSKPSYEEVCRFLFEESMLLDSFQLEDWLRVVSDQIRYRMTAPTIQQPGGRKQSYPADVLLVDEDKASLAARVKQLTTPALTVSENPHSISRRFVSNVLLDPTTAGEDGVRVRSNVLVFRIRLRETQPHLFSICRTDLLGLEHGHLKLVERNARLDEAVIGARNISLLF